MSVDAWHRFVAGVDELEVPGPVLASWKRSRAAGVDPETPSFHRIGERDLEDRLAARAGLVGIAAAHLSWLSAALEHEVHGVCVVDEEGIVLWAAGGAELLDRMHILNGYDWSEARMGTNGAGTPVTTGQAIALGRGEHYCRLWHDLASVGTAVTGRAGEVLGAIELVSLASAEAAPRSLAVAQIGRAIQREHAIAHAMTTAQQARLRAERMRDTLAALARALSPEEIVGAMLEEGLLALHADAGALWMRSADGGCLELAGAVRLSDASTARFRSVPIDAPVAIAEAVRSGRLVLVESLADHQRQFPEQPYAHAFSPGSRACVPLALGGKIIGVLGISVHGWRPFDDDERSLMLALADHCAEALERARLYFSERTTREAAERTAVARDELMALVSHHLRGPLALVATSVHIQQELLASASPSLEQLGMHARQIGDATHRMSSLVKNLLDAARVDAGSVRIAPARVVLSSVLDEVIAILSPTARRRGQTFVLRADEPLVVTCDRDLTVVALSNLVDNAIKFSPEGATIAIRAHREGTNAHICVVDEGPGIAPQDLPRVFQRYWQAPGTARHGIGLGLYIARTYLEAQGGHIRADSKPGHGSEFCFELPLADA